MSSDSDLMPPAELYLILYEGQTESVYTWSENSHCFAHLTKEELEQQYPDRMWYIEVKDVS